MVRKIVFAALMLFILTGFTFMPGNALCAEVEFLAVPTGVFSEAEIADLTTPAAPAVPPMLNVDPAMVIDGYFYTQDAIAKIYQADANKQMAYAIAINGAYHAKGIKTYLCLLPNPYEFMSTSTLLPKMTHDSQKEGIAFIQDNLFQNIIKVDAYGAMERAVEERTYLRSDTRLSGKAAYGIYVAFARAAGFTPLPLSSYTEKGIEYYGNLYQRLPIAGIRDNPDTLTYYAPTTSYHYSAFLYDPNGGGAWQKRLVIDESYQTVDHSDYYDTFMAGDPALGMVETGVKNGKSILVVSDSMDNAFTPFLLPHYQTVYTLDPTLYQYNITEFIKEENIQEVLYMNTVIATTDPTFVGQLAARIGVDVEALLTTKSKKLK